MTDSLRGRWCLLLTLFLLLPTVTNAVDVDPPLENKISLALKTKHAVNFVNVPLSEVVKQLATAANVPYFINRSALADEGVDPESPVTFKRDAQEIGIMLGEVLHPLRLDYSAEPEWLYVTMGVVCGEFFETKFYDVSRLVSLIEARLILYRSPLIDQNTRGQNQGGFGGGQFFSPVNGISPQFAEESRSEAKMKPSYRHNLKEIDPNLPAEACLMAFLQQTTSGQWEVIDGVGGSMTAGKGRLIIRQTPRVLWETLSRLVDLEMMLGDPQHPPRLRLGLTDDDRKQIVKYERLLDVPTNSAPGVMPLKQFIDENLVINGLTVWVDHAALQDEGLAWDELKITVVAGVSRRTLLDEAFSRNVIRILYEDHCFKIVCVAKADEILTTYIYDVSPILEARDREWLSRVLMESTSGQWEEVDGVGGTLDLIANDDLQIAGLLIVRQTEKLHEEIPEILDRLRKPLEIPVKEIEPARTRSIYVLPDVTTAADFQRALPRLIAAPGVSWSPSSVLRVGCSLIVTQTEAVHHRIERLIEAMEKAHKKTVQTEAESTNESNKTDGVSAEKE